MYARLSTGQVPLERLEEVIERAREQTAPLAERGSRGSMTLLDRRTGKVIIVGLWESVADVQATMPRHQRQGEEARAAGPGTGPATTELYEVVAQLQPGS